MIIYRITNTINGKIYIGKTETSMKQRYACYKCDVGSGRHDGIYLYRAFKEYGFDKFRFDVLVDNIETSAELNYAEKYLISFYGSNDKTIGYNSTPGGDGVKLFGENNANFGKRNLKLVAFNKSRTGIKLSDEHRRKISIAGTGRKNSPETILKMKMTRRSEAHIKQISLLNKKKVLCNGIEFPSVSELALHLKVSISTISNAKSRGNKVRGCVINY